MSGIPPKGCTQEMPKPLQMAFSLEAVALCWASPDNKAPYLISTTKLCHPTKDIHLSHLYLVFHSFGHDPYLIISDEGWTTQSRALIFSLTSYLPWKTRAPLSILLVSMTVSKNPIYEHHKQDQRPVLALAESNPHQNVYWHSSCFLHTWTKNNPAYSLAPL